jgi:putative hydrolase of the HAD superfamily
MSPWRAVVFDLDDTLYPEREFVRSGFGAAADWAAETLGGDRERVFAALWGMFESGVRKDTFDQWLTGEGHHSLEHRNAMVGAYRRHRPRIVPYPDVLPALAALKGTVRLGVITEGARSVQEAKLEALGLNAMLDRVVIIDESDRESWKPSPRPFQRWLEGTGIPPSEAVYLGDNPAKDFLGARRAGWASVRVRRADGLHRDVSPGSPEAEPDLEIGELSSLPARLTEARGRTRTAPRRDSGGDR